MHLYVKREKEPRGKTAGNSGKEEGMSMEDEAWEGEAGEGKAWEGEARKGDERRGMMMMETRHGGRKLVGI